MPAGNDRRPGGSGNLAAAGFRSDFPDGRGRRPDEYNPGFFARRGEFGPLAEKTVARMNGVDAVPPCRVDDAADIQIALDGRRRSYMRGFISLADVQSRTLHIG